MQPMLAQSGLKPLEIARSREKLAGIGPKLVKLGPGLQNRKQHRPRSSSSPNLGHIRVRCHVGSSHASSSVQSCLEKCHPRPRWSTWLAMPTALQRPVMGDRIQFPESCGKVAFPPACPGVATPVSKTAPAQVLLKPKRRWRACSEPCHARGRGRALIEMLAILAIWVFLALVWVDRTIQHHFSDIARSRIVSASPVVPVQNVRCSTSIGQFQRSTSSKLCSVVCG